MSFKNKTLILTFFLGLLPVLFTNLVAQAQFKDLVSTNNYSFIAFISMIIFILFSGVLSIFSIVKFVSNKNKPGFLLLSISAEALIFGIALLFFI